MNTRRASRTVRWGIPVLLGLVLLLGLVVSLDLLGWDYEKLECRSEIIMVNEEKGHGYACTHREHVGTFLRIRQKLVLVCVCQDHLR